ncbi:MAG: L-lactate dehydrogenase [Kouleothrix sp.]|jgi:L-lactate dehydrogenase|nr:L-lactate dehydrogenase [Kouleothrix sp.]
MPIQHAADKVGLVGTGMVGASFAYALMQRGLTNELVLVDRDTARAEGEAMDLNHGLPFVRPMRMYAGSYAQLAGAEVVVITAGANQRPGETRLDLLQRNAAVFREIVPQVVAAAPASIIVIATNPVDILTTISDQIAGLAPGRVIGSGTILDTARFRYLLGDYYRVDPRSVHAYIVGEHGDSELALWSLANIGGVRLSDFVGANGRGYDQAALDSIFEQTRTAAYEIIKRKHATYYAIGLGLLAIVEAVLRDQHTVLTVCSPLHGQYGVDGIAISLPTIVGRNGIEEVLNLPISAEEQEAFRSSAQTLQTRLAQLG